MPKSPHNAEYTKQYNRRLILKLLIRDPLSRAELARRTGLTRASITVLTDAMLAEGLLKETEPVMTKRGRTPIPLTIASDALYAFGLFINREKLNVGLVALSGECQILLEEKIGKDQTEVTEQLKRAAERIRGVLDKKSIPSERILGIGVGCPGPLVLSEGRILNPPGFEAWHGLPICSRMQELTGLETRAWDNADALAMYNYYYGRPLTGENFMLLLVDTGIGSGIVRNHKIYHGSGDSSPELGHISICYNGRVCGCGNRGCLEMYASMPALLRDTGFSRWEQLIEGIRTQNDKKEEAERLLHDEAVYLATAIRTAMTLYDLKTVCLAGDIQYGFSLLQEEIRKALCGAGHTAAMWHPDCEILAADHSEHCEMIAAATVMFSEYLQ